LGDFCAAGFQFEFPLAKLLAQLFFQPGVRLQGAIPS
jgi:hypothetical protein